MLLGLITAISFLSLVILSCGASGQSRQAPPLPLTGTLPALSELPQQADPREVSAVQTRNGDEAFLMSPEITTSGGKAMVNAAAGQLQWAIYQFDTSAETILQGLQLTHDGGTTEQTYIMIADFDQGRWELISQGFGNDFTIGLFDLTGNYASPDHVYFAVIGFDGSIFDIESLELTFTSPEPPDWIHIYGGDLFEHAWDTEIDVDGNIWQFIVEGYYGIFKYDQDGNVLFSRRLQFEFNQGQADMTPSPDGGMILAMEDMLFIKLDANGDVVWATEVDWGAEAVHLDVAPSGEIYVIGHIDSYNSESDTYSTFIAKLDSSGNYEWATSWPESSFFNFPRVVATPTGPFALDRVELLLDDLEQYPSVVFRLDLDGNVLAKKYLRSVVIDIEDESEGSTDTRGILANGDGATLVGSRTVVIDNDLRFVDTQIAEVDSGLNLLSTGGSRQLAFVISSPVRDVARKPDGGIAVVQSLDFDDGIRILDFNAANAPLSVLDLVGDLGLEQFNGGEEFGSIAVDALGRAYVGGFAADPVGALLAPSAIEPLTPELILYDLDLDTTLEASHATNDATDSVTVTDVAIDIDVVGPFDDVDALLMRITL